MAHYEQIGRKSVVNSKLCSCKPNKIKGLVVQGFHRRDVPLNGHISEHMFAQFQNILFCWLCRKDIARLLTLSTLSGLNSFFIIVAFLII